MKRRPRGFTLLESVVGISLLALVGLSFAYLLTTSQRFLVQSTNAASSQTDASFAVEHIKRNLTTATNIAQPAAGTSGSTLEFTWQPTAATAVRTSRYEVQGTDLRFIPDTTAAGTFERIAQGIQTLLFDRSTAGTVVIEVTARRTSGGDSRDMRIVTAISPRGVFQ